ncbi:MAG: L-threonylcarbamoyladenylate synthase [Gammaproteobacteria bacterium]
MNNWHIRLAARAVAQGKVIAYPTEAVFGLGCDPLNVSAVRAILALKRRRIGKGLIVIAAEPRQIAGLVWFPSQEIQRRVLASWPGPITWVLPAYRGVPAVLRGVHRSLAVRVTAHPIASAICRRAGALVSTSANPAGCEPARSPARVRSYFRDAVDYICPGDLGPQRLPSEIRDGISAACLRPGGVFDREAVLLLRF